VPIFHEDEQVSTIHASVCIPTYNGAEFIAEAIQSVLTQSFTDFELLVVDDHSSDNTLDIVRSFADSRLSIHQNEKRLGIPRNWNHCLALAQGEYVCLFHQDDVMMPENLERKIKILAADVSINFVHSAAEIRLENSAPVALDNWIEDAQQDFVADGSIYFRKLFFHGNLVCAPTVVTRRQQLLELGGFDEELGYTPDYEMWLKMCVTGRVAFFSQPLLRYRWHGTNASHAYRFRRGVEEMFLARRRALAYFVQETGRQEEGILLEGAMTALAEAKHYTVRLEKYIDDQRAYIGELEQKRDHLWAEVQRLGRSWEEQKAYIEQQQAYTRQLEQSQDRRLSRQVRRLAQHVWRRVHR
jgi:GT2 family glycosyltransferase